MHFDNFCEPLPSRSRKKAIELFTLDPNESFVCKTILTNDLTSYWKDVDDFVGCTTNALVVFNRKYL